MRGVAQLVAHLVWDQGVAGSNPVTPTTKQSRVLLLTVRVLVVKTFPFFVVRVTVIRGVAQLVAHLVWDQGVAGSNPVTPTKNSRKDSLREFFMFHIIIGSV